ncbi:MAG TPA: hypothetical protein VFS77_07575, partial [Pyrinomonadaceae bacterium]|nr:hypothetical protein [Pyrinomonadaceae bacterium]
MVPEVQKPVLEQTTTEQESYGGSISITNSPELVSVILSLAERSRRIVGLPLVLFFGCTATGRSVTIRTIRASRPT